MKDLIKQLEKIALSSSDRAQKNIKNLIGRINHFNETNDTEKLDNCIAEANLWGAVA